MEKKQGSSSESMTTTTTMNPHKNEKKVYTVQYIFKLREGRRKNIKMSSLSLSLSSLFVAALFILFFKE